METTTDRVPPPDDTLPSLPPAAVHVLVAALYALLNEGGPAELAGAVNIARELGLNTSALFTAVCGRCTADVETMADQHPALLGDVLRMWCDGYVTGRLRARGEAA